MWRHLPSSACTYSHQQAPAARLNLTTLGTERDTILQPATRCHCVNNHVPICPPYPSAVFCLTLSLKDPWWMHSPCWLYFCYIFKKLSGSLPLIHAQDNLGGEGVSLYKATDVGHLHATVWSREANTDLPLFCFEEWAEMVDLTHFSSAEGQAKEP